MKIALIAVLLFIFFQDIKHKAVYWFLFPMVLLLGLFIRWEQIGIDFVYNLIFITFLMLALSAYLTLKNRKWINPLEGFFALGDVLFLVAISPFFAFQSYVLFFTTGCLFVLSVHLVLLLIKKTNREIPFAGYLAFYFTGTILVNLISPIPYFYF